MSFTAKVKATGEFFNVTTDLGDDQKQNRDAVPPLGADRYYMGHLFPGSLVGRTQYVEFSEVETAIYVGRDLEEIEGDFRLLPVR